MTKKKTNFRFYQIRMVKAQDDFMANSLTLRATVLCATGGGKTVCFTDLIKKTIASSKKKILIVHPRLALSTNQQKRLKKSLVGTGVEFTSFHSGVVEHTIDGRTNCSTTDVDTLVKIQDEAAGSHITFTSYKSLSKIAHLDFDLIICDEAHYLVQKEYRANLHKFVSKTLFYTGTPIKVVADAQEECMTNTELFGEVIAEVPPSELIPHGYIVAPKLRYLKASVGVTGNSVNYPVTIGAAYKDQLSLVNSAFLHKMLVAMPSTTKFDDIMSELTTIRRIVGDYSLDVYYITADRSVKNGLVLESRDAALEDFDSNTNKCIIIHCDTLAEGIDIDGIGGVLLMRDLGIAKLLQTIGRGCRPAGEDIKPNGDIRKNRIKTNCLVTLVENNGEWLGGLSIESLSKAYEVGGYGDLYQEMTVEYANRGTESVPGDPETTVFDKIKNIQVSDRRNELWTELFGEVA